MSLETLKPYFPWITLGALVLLVGALNPSFLNPASLVSVVADIVPLFIMALGMTFAIYIGGIDLSVQQVANLVTVVATVYLAQFGVFVAVICVLAGFAIGAVSGWVTTRQFVPSFVATLAMGFIALSGARFLSGERALSMNAEARDASFGWMFGTTAGVPHELVIAGILLALAWFLQTRTTFGRALKAVGAGELAAVSSGLNVDRIKILAFALSGTFAAIAGLMFSVKLSGGDANLANGFLILAIVAVLVGGTPLTGGVGGVINTLVGTLIVVVIRTAMVYLEVDATMQQMIFGIILIVAIAMTIDRSKMRIVK
ncbi:monosaccharide ABC transporter membrane protein, CUT2 family [Cribrihabitans marinus]|uniref:Monosaccharide ABC transporter membrane protein, CUT2 family n=1 Tax=Cribrihabitans marinus TaxID=1227549 RepID=A0A1H6W7E4_9RHOB|nr:ABC transporter permease [Cribrihabitans marinus]GGH24776.1 ABC transporter permease [Cribrihabitans marinus]SEJ11164.1 monosaccharide ABC transporter membrane protein, CUT2 family [Cribrihabitans marinus]